MKIKLILFILLLCSCTHHKFSGYVYDFDTEKPVKDVQININGNETQTDSSGYFNVQVNSKTNCNIYLKKAGYANKKVYRKPDDLKNESVEKSKNNTIYLFKKESDFATNRVR